MIVETTARQAARSPALPGLATLVLLMAAVMAGPAAAQDFSPVTTLVNNIVTFVTGPVAQGIAIIALVSVAVVMAFTNWQINRVASVLFAIAIVFGAPSIVTGF